MTKFSAQKVIFDLDGTLVDTAPDLVAAANHCMEHLGRPAMSLASGRPHAGYGALPLITHGLMETGGMDGIDPADHRKLFLDFYAQNLSATSLLFEHAVDVLEALKAQGFQLAICTNKPFYLAEPLIKDLAIDHFFEAVIGGDSFAFHKPDPRHLTMTLEAMSGDGTGLIIGDTKSDIHPAKEIGIPVIAVAYGYSDTPLETLEPDHIVESLAEIPALISQS